MKNTFRAMALILLAMTATTASITAEAGVRPPRRSNTWSFVLKKAVFSPLAPASQVKIPQDGGDPIPLPGVTASDVFNQQNFAGKNSGLFVYPSAQRRELFYGIVQKLLKGEIPNGNDVQNAGFELIPVDDQQGHLGYALKETVVTGGGLYFFRPSAIQFVIVQAPHPLYDEFTEDQAIELFRRLPFRAAFIQNAHRCISNQPHPCGHASSVCEGHATYRDSDASHSEILFHVAHEAAEDLQLYGQNPRFLQLHGFGADNSDPRVAVSDGSTVDKPADTFANKLSAALNAGLQNGKYALSCNNANDPAFDRCGTKNFQGNYTNNDAGLCGDSGEANGRFIHVEQASDFRQNDLTILCKAVKNAIFGLQGDCPL